MKWVEHIVWPVWLLTARHAVEKSLSDVVESKPRDEEKVTWFSVMLQAFGLLGFLDLQQFLKPPARVHGRHGDLQGDLDGHDVAAFPGSLQDCRSRAVGASDFHAPTASDAPR